MTRFHARQLFGNVVGKAVRREGEAPCTALSPCLPFMQRQLYISSRAVQHTIILIRSVAALRQKTCQVPRSGYLYHGNP